MGLQLTTVVHRLGRRWTEPGRPSAAAHSSRSLQGPEDPQDVRAATAAHARTLLPEADRRRYDQVLRAADPGTGEDAGDPAGAAAERVEVLTRMLAATWSVDAVVELDEIWPGLTPTHRAAVLDPVRRLARAGRQSDATTCGSAVLTMLAAAGDPGLALWLATGRVLAHGRPPELEAASDEHLAALLGASPERRFARVQQVVKHRTNARGLLGLRWPARFGTPPWGAVREARFAGLAYRGIPLDDTDRDHLDQVLEEVGTAVGRGVPVPLYTGGDSSAGWSAAVPRHVVLAVGRRRDGLIIWEPSVGALVPVTREVLRTGGRPDRALGGWSHLTWAVLPEL